MQKGALPRDVGELGLSKQLHRLATWVHESWGRIMPCPRKTASPFRYFNSSPEVIRDRANAPAKLARVMRRRSRFKLLRCAGSIANQRSFLA